MSNEQKPSIGRVVHYIDDFVENGEYVPFHCAATITRVWSDTCVNLAYYCPDGRPMNVQSATLDAGATTLHSWHWPERV